MTSGTVVPAQQKLLWTFEVGGWEVGVVEFVDEDSLSACAFLHMCELAICLCVCLELCKAVSFTDVCVSILPETHVSMGGFPKVILPISPPWGQCCVWGLG